MDIQSKKLQKRQRLREKQFLKFLSSFVTKYRFCMSQKVVLKSWWAVFPMTLISKSTYIWDWRKSFFALGWPANLGIWDNHQNYWRGKGLLILKSNSNSLWNSKKMLLEHWKSWLENSQKFNKAVSQESTRKIKGILHQESKSRGKIWLNLRESRNQWGKKCLKSLDRFIEK